MTTTEFCQVTCDEENNFFNFLSNAHLDLVKGIEGQSVCKSESSDEISNTSSISLELNRNLSRPCLDEELEILIASSCHSPGLRTRYCDVEDLPAQEESMKGKLTVVFDLDETLVYARDGTIRPRPFLTELLKELASKCEVLIWTAGVRHYAELVIDSVDPEQYVKHVICRPSGWKANTPVGHAKDLRLLGRDLERTIIIENTPDCVVMNPLHSIILNDYVRTDPSDDALRKVGLVLEGLAASPLSVPAYLADCPHARLETLRNPKGEILSVFMLS